MFAFRGDPVIPSDNFYIVYLYCILKGNSEIHIEQNKAETHTENKLRVGRWDRGWGLGENGENRHRDVKDSIGNTVNDTNNYEVPGGCEAPLGSYNLRRREIVGVHT